MRFRYSTDEKGRPVKKALVFTREEHGIDVNDVDPQAVLIVNRLREAGYETYVVGGAVRDLLLKNKPKDFDIVSSASPQRIKRVFRNSRIIGNRFRLVHVFFGPKIFEVSTFRSIKDGPTGNTFGTIEDDVLRRDFTLNALFYDPVKQVVIDFVGAMKDIRAKKIRPIIPLAHIFTDDPVRMIRAVKYGATTGFKMPFSLSWKIRKQSPLLAGVSPSRLTEEIFKILHSTHASRIADALDNLGLYRYLQPEAEALFRSRPGFRDAYMATFAALNQPDFKNLPGESLAALVRDYLEDAADWTGDGEEALPLQDRYKAAFAAARKFVLPMNPPRLELDHALKLLFAEHGVVVKRGRFHDGAVQKPGGEKAQVPPAAPAASGKRRRRRRKPAAAQAPVPPVKPAET